jgi:hypothetical protein
MVKIQSIIDYSFTGQLVVSLLAFIFFKFQYRSLLVYTSFIIFFSYWMIRIIFNPELKDRISGD